MSLDSLQETNHLLKICDQNIHLFDIWTHIGGLTTVGASKTDWYWVESGKKANFQFNFAPDQPDNAGGNEMCLSLGKQPGNFFFNDISCYGVHQYKFICQTKESLY